MVCRAPQPAPFPADKSDVKWRTTRNTDPSHRNGVRLATRRDLILMLPVWVLSFPSTGNSLRQLRAGMRQEIPGLLTAIQGERAIVSRGGRAFAWWVLLPNHSWYVNYICAFPRGRGSGTLLLRALLDMADEAHASVVLHCRTTRVRWYRRHGFLLVPATDEPTDRVCERGGLVKMRRPARSIARRRRSRRHAVDA
jgi:GNAT superfamily N-acetyltransferase